MDIKLKYKTDTFRISKFGSITGQIYFMFDDQFFFPEEKWNDFVVIILGWWLENLLGLLNNSISSAELDFMDGPFSLKLDLINSEINIQCVNNDQNVVEYKTVVNIVEFSVLISDLSKQVLNLCNENNWSSKDTINLEKVNSIIIENIRSK